MKKRLTEQRSAIVAIDRMMNRLLSKRTIGGDSWTYWTEAAAYLEIAADWIWDELEEAEGEADPPVPEPAPEPQPDNVIEVPEFQCTKTTEVGGTAISKIPVECLAKEVTDELKGWEIVEGFAEDPKGRYLHGSERFYGFTCRKGNQEREVWVMDPEANGPVFLEIKPAEPTDTFNPEADSEIEFEQTDELDFAGEDDLLLEDDDDELPLELDFTAIPTEKTFNEQCVACPHCEVVGQSGFVDGDTVPDPEEIPENLVAEIYFIAFLELYECNQCHKQSYFLLIQEVDNPNVSEEWLRTHVWEQINFPPPDEKLTFHFSGNLPIPKSWYGERRKTSEGVFRSHWLGPFISNESLYGPYGVARCAGQSVWKEAGEVVLNVLRILHPVGERGTSF
ncbi:MAG: hypothetical protein ACLQVJ_03325 [Syntrophobacteraceae bacterium]